MIVASNLVYLFQIFSIYAICPSFIFCACAPSRYVQFFGVPSLINYKFSRLLYLLNEFRNKRTLRFSARKTHSNNHYVREKRINYLSKQIEEVRKKLSGNQQFHTRLVFQRLDYQKKGQITPEDIVYNLSPEHPIVNLVNCQNFCRKYSVSGAITYEE